jgi:hypothetical protein
LKIKLPHGVAHFFVTTTHQEVAVRDTGFLAKFSLPRMSDPVSMFPDDSRFTRRKTGDKSGLR